jgi:hypothetical protein
MRQAYARRMARNVSVLVVAKVTANSPELIAALKQRQDGGSLHATLLMPCQGPGLHSQELARPNLDAALDAWREAGLIDIDGVVGDQDPLVAIGEAWDPQRYDEIIVSTLPGQASQWLRWDMPQRVARQTNATVTHVMSRLTSLAALGGQ